MTTQTSAPRKAYSWRLRPALPGDAASLWANCLPDDLPDRIDDLLARCQQAALNRRGLGLVAVLPDERVIGFGQLTLWPSGGEISDVIVGAAWRGTGIGTALVRRLIAAAQEMAAERVEIGAALRNTRALALYRRLGFQDGRILELDLGNGPEPVMYLGMSLQSATG